ncbi:palindromic element RPE1 domain-containing protein [Candidatus Tisiphia endosymbiont of Metellina segmentata]|uniref:palindromic element RPE1 domain-containing protein n=1 Tax=Candidatus Tisiphia endosymbiont of Metellina segmentata TaxID=3066274 RepID=UPI00313E4243
MLSKVYNDLILQIKANKYDFLRFDLIKQDAIKDLAAQLALKYDIVVVIGFGASSLNVRALLSIKAVATKRLIYLDSLDQLEIDEKLALVDLSKAVFFSLSKSGNTNETYLLTKYVLEVLHVPPQNIYVIVPFSNNLLRNLAESFGTNCLEHDNIRSGRFGIISNASLLPTAVAGVDVHKVVLAASKKISDIIFDGFNICEIAEYYLNQYSLNRHMLVMFNYCYQLDGLCRWQQQIIAESLGKNGFGITPIIAKGTFDQHSQLQLYLEGPDDKFYQVITNKASSDIRPLSKLACAEGFEGDASPRTAAYSNSVTDSSTASLSKSPAEVEFRKRSIEIALTAHANNIYNALDQVKRPVKLENFVYIDEQVIVDQIIHVMLSTILIANHLKIDPFNQPSVDEYKKV